MASCPVSAALCSGMRPSCKAKEHYQGVSKDSSITLPAASKQAGQSNRLRCEQHSASTQVNVSSAFGRHHQLQTSSGWLGPCCHKSMNQFGSLLDFVGLLCTLQQGTIKAASDTKAVC